MNVIAIVRIVVIITVFGTPPVFIKSPVIIFIIIVWCDDDIIQPATILDIIIKAGIVVVIVKPIIAKEVIIKVVIEVIVIPVVIIPASGIFIVVPVFVPARTPLSAPAKVPTKRIS